MIRAVAVVIPVHDEAERLERCLASVDRALAALPPTLQSCAVVVLDACSDRSAEIANAWSTPADPRARSVMVVQDANVGRARAAGVAHACTTIGHHPMEHVWLGNTDADSEVPATWLVDQLRFAAQGAEAVAGTIVVTDWHERPSGFAESFARFYEERAGDSHPHVHGSNLGVRADAYFAVGGFPPLATGEDHALWNALGSLSKRRVAPRSLTVTTSARRRGRAPGGFSTFLDHLGRARTPGAPRK